MINLLPPSIKQDVKFAKYNVTLVEYAIVLAATVAIVAFLMLFGEQTLSNTKSDIEKVLATDRARVADLQSINTQATALSNNIDTIGSILDQEVKFSYLLQEIGSIMPAGAKLSALTLSQDATQPIRLSVDVTTAERAGVLQQNLAESRLFIGADILTVNQANDPTYAFAADLQAYFDPSFPLNSLDDPVEEEAPSEEPVVEEQPVVEPEATPETTEESAPATESPDETETEGEGSSSGGAL